MSDRRFARLLVPALVSAALFLPVRAQQQCWQLPPGADRGGYWYENYLKVEEEIKKGRLGSRDVDDAILRLQTAIKAEATSSLRKSHPKERYEFEYLPYFLLGVLYNEKGEVELAEQCLERAAQYGAVQRSRDFGKQFKQLQATLLRRKEARGYVAVAESVKKLQQGGWLSAQGVAKAGEVAQAAQEVTTTKDDQRLAAATTTLAGSVAQLVDTETGRLTGMVEQLRTPSWAPAFGGQPLQADLGGCQSARQVSGKEDPGSLTRALDDLDACRRGAEGALRRAGETACGTLSGRRDELRGRIGFARDEWPSALESAAAVPDLPQACGRSWSQATLDEAWQSLQAMDFPAAAKSYADLRSDLDGRIATAQARFRQELETQRARIIVVSKQCQTDLSIGSVNDRLGQLDRRLRTALASDNLRRSPELQGMDKQIDTALAELADRARVGAEDLFGQRELPKMDAAAFSPIPAARDALDPRNPSEAALDRLCSTARQAREAIVRWGRENLPELAARVDGYRWLLRTAGGWSSAPDCVRQSLQELPPPPGRGAGASWVERANQGLSTADACVRDYRTARESWTTDLRRDLESAMGSLERMPVAGDEAMARRVDTTRRRLSEAMEAMRKVAPVLDLGPDVTAEALRDALRTAGLDVPAEQWQRASEPRGIEAQKVVLAIRDEATNEPLEQAARELSANLPLIRRLGTFLALDNAFAAFGRGDLDGAILALRSSDQATEGAEGRAAALRHAVLGFFLYTKSETLIDRERQGTVASMLVEDARSQLRAAFRAQPDFQLPETLIRDRRFRDFVEECRSM